MIKNYFRTAWRNLRKNKIFSLINVLGLASGLTCFMLIAVFVYSELRYDKYPADAKNIYRVILSATGNGDVAVYPNVDMAVGEGMKNSFSEITAFTRMSPATDYVKYEERSFKEEHLAFADSNFLQIFSIPLISGNEKEALVQPNSAVITKAFAKKYFGNEEPVGKALHVGINGAVYKVTGVIDKVPDNSHFHCDAFLSMSTWHVMNPTWSNLGPYTYLVLNKNADPGKLETKFRQLVEKYVVPEIQHDMGVSLAEAQKSVNTFVFSLQPLTDIHLRSHTKYELEPPGDIRYVYIFSILGLFILLLACINFTNLSAARAAKRAKEVGIRKVIGSQKKQLVLQFLAESVMLTFISMLIAYALIFFLLPYFNQLAGKNVSFSFFMDYRTVLIMLLVSFVAGTLAGVYPAFFISSFSIIKILKGVSPEQGSVKRSLSRSLLVFQFFVSTALIISTIVVYRQFHFLQNKKTGYDKEQVLFLPDARLLGPDQEAFRQQLLGDSRVVSASISRSVPGGNFIDGTEVYPKNENGNGTEIHMNIYHVDYDYLPTLGIKLLRGRNFTRGFSTDSSSAIVINEAAARELGWTTDNAVGKSIVRSGQQELNVIGVIADFNYTSAKQKVAPLMMMLRGNYGGLIVKMNTGDIRGFLHDMKSKWDAFSPPGSFEYNFLDEKFAALYKSEQRIQKVFSVFAALAVIIACLGLFGLSASSMEQRTKEIGIRKVLGASVRQVFFLVSREFLVLVSISFVLSVPVTWWAMNKWLQDYAYRTNLAWWMFALSGGVALLVALITISFHAVRTATANPVKSLRSE